MSEELTPKAVDALDAVVTLVAEVFILPPLVLWSLAQVGFVLAWTLNTWVAVCFLTSIVNRAQVSLILRSIRRRL